MKLVANEYNGQVLTAHKVSFLGSPLTLCHLNYLYGAIQTFEKALQHKTSKTFVCTSLHFLEGFLSRNPKIGLSTLQKSTKIVKNTIRRQENGFYGPHFCV